MSFSPKPIVSCCSPQLSEAFSVVEAVLCSSSGHSSIVVSWPTTGHMSCPTFTPVHVVNLYGFREAIEMLHACPSRALRVCVLWVRALRDSYAKFIRIPRARECCPTCMPVRALPVCVLSRAPPSRAPFCILLHLYVRLVGAGVLGRRLSLMKRGTRSSD